MSEGFALERTFSGVGREARGIFRTLDTNSDGELSSSELCARLSDFGLGDEEIQSVFYQMDTDGSGAIDEDEWVAGYGIYKRLIGGQSAAARPQKLLEDDILAALAAARADPQATAARIRTRLAHYDGTTYAAPGRDAPLSTKEGKAAVDDALAFLAQQPALPGFGAAQVAGLQLAAEDHVADVGAVGTASHEGSDGTHVSARQERYGGWSGNCGECLWYGRVGSWVTGESLIDDLIVDDGVPTRGHRLCIYEGRYGVAGVAVGLHTVFGECRRSLGAPIVLISLLPPPFSLLPPASSLLPPPSCLNGAAHDGMVGWQATWLQLSLQQVTRTTRQR